MWCHPIPATRDASPAAVHRAHQSLPVSGLDTPAQGITEHSCSADSAQQRPRASTLAGRRADCGEWGRRTKPCGQKRSGKPALVPLYGTFVGRPKLLEGQVRSLSRFAERNHDSGSESRSGPYSSLPFTNVPRNRKGRGLLASVQERDVVFSQCLVSEPSVPDSLRSLEPTYDAAQLR